MKICVFCASSSGIDPGHRRDCETLGRWLGANGHTLVWGGCNVGLMEVIGSATRAAGGRTLAVIPRFLVERGLGFEAADERVVTADMQGRKAELRRQADAFVTLPGGIGTWEEVLEVLALEKLGQLDRPIFLANWGGYYDPLLLQLRRSLEAGFSPPEIASLFEVAASVEALIAGLDRAMGSGPRELRVPPRPAPSC